MAEWYHDADCAIVQEPADDGWNLASSSSSHWRAPGRLPAVQPLFVTADAHAGVEELAEARLGQQLGARAVAHDAAIAHENDALDLGEDVAEVVGDEHESGFFGGEPAESIAEFALRGEIERVGRLVEQELAGTMDQGARDEDASFLAGRHFADEAMGEMGCLDAGEGFGSAGAHLRLDVEVGPQGGGGKKSGDDGVEAGGDGGSFAGQVGTDHAEVLAELGQVPAIAAKDAHAHEGLNDGINLAGDGKDERRFSTAVGTEDGDMLSGADGEVHVVEDDSIAACNVDLLQFEELIAIDRLLGRSLHIC